MLAVKTHHEISNGYPPMMALQESSGVQKSSVSAETVERKKISAMFLPSGKSRHGKVLESLQLLALDPTASTVGEEDYCQKLQELAVEQKFEVRYVDMPLLSKTGTTPFVVFTSVMADGHIGKDLFTNLNV